MPFTDDCLEPEDGEPPVVTRPSAWSWAPARLWTCPGCASTVLTRDAAPRCGRCGFREGT